MRLCYAARFCCSLRWTTCAPFAGALWVRHGSGGEIESETPTDTDRHRQTPQVRKVPSLFNIKADVIHSFSAMTSCQFLSILVNVGPPLQVLHARVPILKLCFEGELEARSLQSPSSHTLFAAKETKAESLCAISYHFFVCKVVKCSPPVPKKHKLEIGILRDISNTDQYCWIRLGLSDRCGMVWGCSCRSILSAASPSVKADKCGNGDCR